MKEKEKLIENIPVCVMSTARSDASLAAEKLKQRMKNLDSKEDEIISKVFEQYEKEKNDLEKRREEELSMGGDQDEINRTYDTLQIEAADKLSDTLKTEINEFAQAAKNEMLK